MSQLRAATFKRGRKTPAVKVWLCGASFRLRMRDVVFKHVRSECALNFSE